jgi:hypothetical protein
MLSPSPVAVEVARSTATPRLMRSLDAGLAVVMCASLSGVLPALDPVVGGQAICNPRRRRR